jgi:quercetin dioxygenase-like cupin family protein
MAAWGSADYFTGTVRVDPLFQAPGPARVTGGNVTFEPGARTAWHAYPLGQARSSPPAAAGFRRGGGPVEEIRPGDVVWIPPGVKHWHGAAPTTAMTHIAIEEKLDGKVVGWSMSARSNTGPTTYRSYLDGEKTCRGAN